MYACLSSDVMLYSVTHLEKKSLATGATEQESKSKKRKVGKNDPASEYQTHIGLVWSSLALVQLFTFRRLP